MTASSAAGILDLLERDLIRKQEAPSGIFMREVGSPDGRQRADALFIKGVGGKGIDGYEVKISRADLAAELADPAKVESWKKYCRRWWLVIPSTDLLDGFDIPDDWGIKTPPTAKNRVAFTVVRPAPVLEPHDIGPALGRLATVWAYRQRDQRIEVRSAERERERALTERNEMRDKLAEAGVSDRPESVGMERARALSKALSDSGRYLALPEGQRSLDALVSAVLDVLEGQSIKKEMARIAQGQLRDLDRAVTELGKSRYVQTLREQLKEAVGT